MLHLGSSTNRARVLIADDHSIVAEGVRTLVQESHDVIGIIGDGRTLLTEAPRLKPDVIVLDISMPLLNGLAAAERLKPSLPTVKFVFLTMIDDCNLAAATLSLGAVGYVLKHSATSELMKAISEVLDGRPYITPKLRGENLAAEKARTHQFTKELSSRQKDVLQLLAEGRPMKEVAHILKISEKTVMFHKYHIMKSFSLKSNAELVLFALKHRLIFIEPAFLKAPRGEPRRSHF